MGMILLGVGFALALQEMFFQVLLLQETCSVDHGLFIPHIGELCLSPLGLSYLSKLVPARMIAFMFGVYYLAIAIGNKTAHSFGGNIDSIAEESGISFFFLILTLLPIGLGILAAALHPLLKKLMHGVK